MTFFSAGKSHLFWYIASEVKLLIFVTGIDCLVDHLSTLRRSHPCAQGPTTYMSTRPFDIGIHVYISSFYISIDIQNQHEGRGDGRTREEEEREEMKSIKESKRRYSFLRIVVIVIFIY